VKVRQPVLLYLLRHGPTKALPGCLLGSTDAPLSGAGVSRLHSLIEPHLQQIAQWYCSPLLRARQTLAYLHERGCHINQPVYDERLREIDFGSWELRNFADIAAADSARVAAWQEQYMDFAFPNGESVQAFISRVKAILDTLSTSSGSIGIVTHGGVIRTIICLALGLPPSNYLLFDVLPASLTIIELFSRGGVLRGLNL
jgi:alpha-ribazole phosphatase